MIAEFAGLFANLGWLEAPPGSYADCRPWRAMPDRMVGPAVDLLQIRQQIESGLKTMRSSTTRQLLDMHLRFITGTWPPTRWPPPAHVQQFALALPDGL